MVRAKISRLWPIITIVLLLAGCAPIPPDTKFVSPLRVRQLRQYVPLAINDRTLNKKGIGGDCETARMVGADWYYGWSSWPSQCQQAAYLEQPLPIGVPMIWGDWGNGPVPQVAASEFLLLFNEPDLPQQANITPARATELQWRIEQSPLGRRRIGAPAPSHVGSWWLEAMRSEFITRYGRPPKWDFLTVHCYFATAEECIAHVRWYLDKAKEWRIPDGIWVTEFAILPCTNQVHGVGGQPGIAAAIREANRLIDWFESVPEIKTYFWYISYQPHDAWYAFQPMPDCDTSLRFHDGRLTAFGRWYAGR